MSQKNSLARDPQTVLYWRRLMSSGRAATQSSKPQGEGEHGFKPIWHVEEEDQVPVALQSITLVQKRYNPPFPTLESKTKPQLLFLRRPVWATGMYSGSDTSDDCMNLAGKCWTVWSSHAACQNVCRSQALGMKKNSRWKLRHRSFSERTVRTGFPTLWCSFLTFVWFSEQNLNGSWVYISFVHWTYSPKKVAI